jgi:hypothetical protein
VKLILHLSDFGWPVPPSPSPVRPRGLRAARRDRRVRSDRDGRRPAVAPLRGWTEPPASRDTRRAPGFPPTRSAFGYSPSSDAPTLHHPRGAGQVRHHPGRALRRSHVARDRRRPLPGGARGVGHPVSTASPPAASCSRTPSRSAGTCGPATGPTTRRYTGHHVSADRLLILPQTPRRPTRRS